MLVDGNLICNPLLEILQIRGGRTTNYVYDASGTLMAEYDTAPDTVANAFQYHHLDHLGSARLGTNSSGGLGYRKDYFPFRRRDPSLG